MSGIRSAFLLILMCVCCVAGCGKDASSLDDDEQRLTLFAASSLRECVEDIAAEWVQRGGRKPRLQFSATSTLARQIEQGASPDIFIAAAPEWLDVVDAQERFDWLSNRLVVVVRAEANDFSFERLPSLALANPQVPAGKYAMAALEASRVELPKRIVYGSSVRDVLSKVAEGGAYAGVVYATDASLEPRLKVVHTFPEEAHPRITYSVGVLRESGHEFFAALREPWALRIAKERGFLELTP